MNLVRLEGEKGDLVIPAVKKCSMKKAVVSGSRVILLCCIIAISTGCATRKHTYKAGENEVNAGKKTYDIKAEYAFTEATRQKLFGNLDEAVVLYAEAIRLNPENAAAYYELSNIYQYLKETDVAIGYAEKAREKDTGNLWYIRHLAGLYHMKGDKEKTIRTYENMREEFPERYEIWFDLALLYKENGQIQQSLKLLDKMEEKLGVNDMVNMTKYSIYEADKMYEKSIKELEKLTLYFPEEVKYMGLLAETYDEMGDTGKAIEMYNKLFEIDADNGTAMMSIASFYERLGEQEKCLAYLKKGFASPDVEVEEKLQSMIFQLNKEENIEKHEPLLNELITILEEEYTDDIRVMTLKADYYLRLKKLAEASEVLKQVVRINTENYDIWEQLIFIENELENHKDLTRIAGEAIRHFPDEKRLYYYKAIGEYLIKQYDSLIITAKEALSKTDENHELRAEFLTLLGEAYHGKNMHRESDQAFDDALKINPDDVHILNNYAYYLSVRGEKLEKALEYSGKTIVAEPENPTYLDTYAWVLYKSMNFPEALIYIERAIKYGGDNNPVIVEHYGDILFMNGMKDDAVVQWMKAKDMGGDKEKLNEKIHKGF